MLQLLCVFFEVCGRQAHPVMRKVSGERLGPGQEVVLALGLWAPGGHVCLLSALCSPPYPDRAIAGAPCSIPWKVTGPIREGQEKGWESPHLLTSLC